MAGGAAMLKRIVKDHDVRTERRSALRAANPIGGYDDRNVGIQSFVNERLVLAVASHHDRRVSALTHQQRRDPRGDRSLARATHGQVSHADRGQCKRTRATKTGSVETSVNG